ARCFAFPVCVEGEMFWWKRTRGFAALAVLAGVCVWQAFPGKGNRLNATTAADSGCPATSPPTQQTRATLQAWANDNGLANGVTYDPVSAQLGLKKTGGSFSSTAFNITSLAQYVCGGDFNKDGKVDVAWADSNMSQVGVYKNNTTAPTGFD